ncbi:MAG: hypothetical protein V1780_02190 [Chloroflexota bacterium]
MTPTAKKTLAPGDIGRFLAFTSVAICFKADMAKTPVKEMTSQVEAAIALGFLLAKRQPELVDACLEYWNQTRQTDADKYVDSMLHLYQELQAAEQEAPEKEKGKKGKASAPRARKPKEK